MNLLADAFAHKRSGRFREALHALQTAQVGREERLSSDILRAELFAAVGQYDRAIAGAASALLNANITASQRATCEQVLGEVRVEAGDVDAGLAHFQRAALAAEHGADLERLLSVQLNVMAVLSERSGPGAATAILAEVRRVATKLGDPSSTIRLHLLVAQTEAKRALFENSRKHVAIARSVLDASPHAYLQAFSDNLQLAIALLSSDLDAARECGAKAVESAERSGVATIRGAALANMGNLHLAVGDFEQATTYFERALIDLPSGGARTNATLDSLARVHTIRAV